MLDFPNSPTDGQIVSQPNGVTYKWNAAKTRWDVDAPDGAISVTNMFGTVTSTPNILRTTGGFSVIKSGTGIFDYTFDTPFPDDNYNVQVTTSAGSTAFSRVQGIAATGFSVHMLDTANAHVDRGHEVSIQRLGVATKQVEYSEGVWMPTLFDAESGGNEATYSRQEGSYVKINKMVHVKGRLTLSGNAGMTGTNQARMGGLPFKTRADVDKPSCMHFSLARNMNITANSMISGTTVNDAFRINLEEWDIATGSSNLSVNGWANLGDGIFDMIFYTD